LFGGYGLALVALALVVFGAIECPPFSGEKMLPKLKAWFLWEKVEIFRKNTPLGCPFYP